MNETLLGFYLGVFFIILLYNLQWYLTTKQKSYLYYIFMHLCIIVLNLNLTQGNNVLTVSLAVGAVTFTTLFSKEFLNLKTYAPKIEIYLKNSIFVFFAFTVILFFADSLLSIKYVPYSILFSALAFIGFYIYKKGYKLAKYYIFAWVAYIPFIFIGDLYRIFSKNIVDFNLGQIGNILEATILSFALMEKTKQLIKQKEEREKLLIHQGRLAALGEMLANISHQWRQPLNRIATFIINMQVHLLDGKKEPEYLNKNLEEMQEQLEYMSTTIDDFTNFYKKQQPKTTFLASKALNNACSITASSLKAKDIKLNLKIEEDFSITSYEKELAQVILNLIQNAKEALEINKIENPKIDINIKNNSITILDNAQGVDEKIINQIFDPYFTTKELHKGTGLGLYMSKLILEKNFNAKLQITNFKDGAKFTILF